MDAGNSHQHLSPLIDDVFDIINWFNLIIWHFILYLYAVFALLV